MGTEVLNLVNLKEVVEILIKHFDLHEGLYDLALEMQIGVGNFGPNKDSTLPGAAFGLRGLKLIKANAIGPHTVDAAKANPATHATEKKPVKKSLPKY